MFATVNIETPDMRLARAWLEAAVTHLFPDLWAADTDGRITTTLYEDGPINTRKLTPKRWAEALAALADQPETVSVGVGQGERIGRASMNWAGDRRLRLEASTPNDVDWSEFLVQVLGDADPVYGQVSSNATGASVNTELDLALLRFPDDSVAEGRVKLRGYSWITIVPKELADRVDLSTMHKATPLPSGAVILQATATPAGYDAAAMNEVFRAVAPVLPAGKPKQLPGQQLQIVYEDAAG